LFVRTFKPGADARSGRPGGSFFVHTTKLQSMVYAAPKFPLPDFKSQTKFRNRGAAPARSIRSGHRLKIRTGEGVVKQSALAFQFSFLRRSKISAPRFQIRNQIPKPRRGAGPHQKSWPPPKIGSQAGVVKQSALAFLLSLWRVSPPSKAGASCAAGVPYRGEPSTDRTRTERKAKSMTYQGPSTPSTDRAQTTEHKQNQ
jgi:hypothetical protein